MQYQRSLIEQVAARVGLAQTPRRGGRPGKPGGKSSGSQS
jgi:hypothetical protein